MLKLLLLVLFICVVAGEQQTERANIIWTDTVKENFCQNLKKSLFNPMRCADPNVDPAMAGKQFKATHNVAGLDPVILLPGIGGSGLEAQLHKNNSVAWYCFKTWDWFRIWFATEELLVQKCWMDNLKLTYDPSTGIYNNTVGVDIGPIDFGGVHGVDYLDYIAGIPISFSSIYAPMIQSMEEVGYVPGQNLRGAPFDWRLPASFLEINGWYDALKQLIEDTYNINGGKAVHLIAHSLGSPTMLYFLNKQPAAWRNTYVKSFIPVAGPWSGAPKALRAAISGDNFGLSFWNIEILQKAGIVAIARGAGGLIQLFPNTVLFNPNTIIVSTPTNNYTISDYAQLWAAIGAMPTYTIMKATNTLSEIRPPNVTTYCLYGYGVPTEISYNYVNGDFTKDPIIDNSDMGDGTVPLDSLAECNKWTKLQTAPVIVQQYDLVEHSDIIKDPQVIQYILSITTANTLIQ